VLGEISHSAGMIGADDKPCDNRVSNPYSW